MLRKFSLNTQILAGAAIGIVFGLILHAAGQSNDFARTSVYICDLVGRVFVDLLKMILIPLVFTSITLGIVNLKAHAQMGRVWKLTLAYFLCTPALAVLLGLILANVFRPGAGVEIHMFQDAVMSFKNMEQMTFPQFLKSFVSSLFLNPLTAMAKGEVLAVVIFSIILGIALIRLQESTKTIQRFLEESFDVVMLIVSWIMVIAPFGIMALLAKLVATQNVSVLQALWKFILVVVGGTLFHGIVVLPALLYFLTGMKPLYFFNQMKEALITAFSTSSSSATMPVTLNCVENNLKVDKNIAGFVVPMGTTMNMDGTALYEAMAAIFIANLVGIELNLAQQIVVFFMAILASIGAPGIPSAGMVTMIMVLQSVGLPAEAIAILLPIDRPLDAIRTVVNVEGDAIGSLIVQKYSRR